MVVEEVRSPPLDRGEIYGYGRSWMKKVWGNDRSRALERQGVKTRNRGRSSSRDMMGDLETRMIRMEITLSEVQEMFGDIFVCIEGGEFGMEELEAKVQKLKSSLRELWGEMLGNLIDTSVELRQLGDALKALMEAMYVEMVVLKVKVVEMAGACVNGVVTMQAGSWVDASKLKEFKSSWVAKDADNFLWYME